MRQAVAALLTMAGLAGGLTTTPAAAQTAPDAPQPPHHMTRHPMHHPMRHHEDAMAGSDGPVIDHGPYTPEANGAYQGGGMVLEGAPGAPPPRPEPTPPGQTPRGMVPPGQ